MEKKNKKTRDNLIILVISCFVILMVILPLLHQGFPRTHDVNLYMTWLYEFDQGFREGHLLPRWSADLWLGYGSPLFNYIQPFFYYAAEGFHLLGFSLVNSVKAVISLSIIFSFVFMFWLAKEFFGKWPALILATLYIYLPYRIGLLYIRGNFSEYLATALFPLIFFSFYKFLKTNKLGYFLLSSLSIALLLLTHNIQAILFLPVLIVYIIIFYWRQIKKILKSGLAIIYGALLASFFWIPALLEKKYAQLEILATGRYDFHKYFIGLKELFLPSWGLIGADFYQVGAIGILIIIFTVYVIIKHKKVDFNMKHLLFFLVLVIFCLFLTTKPSTFIWEKVPLLSNVQFPWRILSLVAFGLTILGSVIIFPELYKIFIKREPTKKYFIILSTFIFIFSLASFFVWNTTKPILYIQSRADNQYSAYYQLFDESNTLADSQDNENLTIKKIALNLYSVIPDVIPKGVDVKLAKEKMLEITDIIMQTVIERQRSFFINKLEFLSGKANISQSKILSEKYEFNIESDSETKARINTFWFPGWQAYIDGKEVIIDHSNSLDLMDITIAPGTHLLKVEFKNTPLRNYAWIISLVAFIIFLISILFLLLRRFFIRNKYANQKYS